ncbi:hypothetical protein ACOSP7_020644 [Xanthoceras sorbifolium]
MASSSSFDSQQTQDDRSSNTHGMDFSSLAKTLHFNLPIKLDEDNFIYWKTQILPAINALDLEDFIDSTKTPPSHNQSQQQPQANFHQASAYLATPGSVGDPSWYVDSGATNHITSDLNNLNLKSEYKGYCCLHPSGRIYVTRHAEFNEMEFPYAQLFPLSPANYGFDTASVPLHTIVNVLSQSQVQPGLTLQNSAAPILSHPAAAALPQLFTPPASLGLAVSSPILAPLQEAPGQHLEVTSSQQSVQTLPTGAAQSTHPMITRSKLGCKWVFRTKYNPNGTILKHKARLLNHIVQIAITA